MDYIFQTGCLICERYFGPGSHLMDLDFDRQITAEDWLKRAIVLAQSGTIALHHQTRSTDSQLIRSCNEHAVPVVCDRFLVTDPIVHQLDCSVRHDALRDCNRDVKLHGGIISTCFRTL
jgi:hypothetical protein